MSTEKVPQRPARSSAEPVHADVSFEERDLNIRALLGFGFALALSVIFTYIVSIYILRATVNVATKSDTPPPPVRAELGPNYRELPPEPRLQGVPGHTRDPQQDRRNKLEADSAALEKTGWLDERAGIAQIPIEDAMRIIAEKGLPGAPATPAEKKK